MPAFAGMTGESGKAAGLRRVLEIGFHDALQFDGHGVAVAVEGFADADADPAFGDAVFFDVGFLGAVEADADAAV